MHGKLVSNGRGRRAGARPSWSRPGGDQKLSAHIGRKSVEGMGALVPRVLQAAAAIELGLQHSINWAD